MRIGVLGGTFDPVHIGHLVAATEAAYELELDRLLLVVANEPWQKTGERTVTPAEERFAVVEAAVSDVDHLEASHIEIDRGGPSYTVDTIEELRRREPDSELFLVVGADVAGELDTWHRVEDLCGLVTLVIVDRGGVAASSDPQGWKVMRLRIPALEISSSDLRLRLQQGRPVDFLIPTPSIRCIRRLGLYSGAR
ncbi:MAG TPA: nicotinate-nucleotide adenylyltransferase [Acidimicrobiales bacterium]|nr:nicotinate-nucleotide adenylyltransferase [Acidimicrobiales bacterium]